MQELLPINAYNRKISFDNLWSQGTDACTDIKIWIYWNTGVLDEFGAVSIKVASYNIRQYFIICHRECIICGCKRNNN